MKEKVYETKDSGERRTFDTGARRDTATGKGRYDLLPPKALHHLAQLLERGADKYGARNWEKGMPLSVYLNSATRHLFQLLARHDDEDHAAAVLFNVAAYIETLDKIEAGTLPEELDDLPPLLETEEKKSLKNADENLTPKEKPANISSDKTHTAFLQCYRCGCVQEHKIDHLAGPTCLACGSSI